MFSQVVWPISQSAWNSELDEAELDEEERVDGFSNGLKEASLEIGDL